MMVRSHLFELNKPATPLDEDLKYPLARRKVPSDLPFITQDAMVNGARV